VFRQWLDPFAPLENLNESLWERFYVYLSGLVGSGKMSGATMAGTLGAARAFIRSRWERRFIELPRNLNSRILAASVPVQEIVVFTRQEIIHLLEAASERKRLYLLLMLNCGFYPVDIAALKHGEVDWKTGRISRQRSKTRGRSPKVPKVDYLLWRETFKLLREYRSDHPDLVLVNSNGSPLWTEVEKDGKFNRNNSNRSQSGKE
jgi:integrase